MVWCAHRSDGVRRVRLGHPGKKKKAESLVQMPQVGRVYGNSLLIVSLFLGKEETEFSAVLRGKVVCSCCKKESESKWSGEIE